jgi:diguanylate cyclase (GGDEF)-like protein
VTDFHPTSFSLLDAARALARGTDLDAKLAALVAHASAIAGDRGGAIVIHDAEAGTLTSTEGDVVLTVDHDLTSPIGEAIRDRRPLWSSDADASVRSVGLSAARLAVVPLVIEDRLGASVEGLLLVGVDDDGPSAEARDILMALGDLAAVAIRQARLHNSIAEQAEYLERLARTDPLTGLADRRTFDQMLELEIARAARQSSPLAVAIFDVDGMSGINERYGATVGDDVLRRVAAVIADTVRLVDTVARFGEDEFAVIAPGDVAGVVARRVRDAVAQGAVVDGGVRPSVSAAVVHHPADGATSDELVGALTRRIGEARSTGAGTVRGLRDQA